MTSTTSRHLEALPTQRAAGSIPVRLRRRWRLFAAVVIGTVVLAACGDDDAITSEPPPVDSETPEEVTEPVTVDAEPDEDETQTIEVGLVDFGFGGVPAHVPAGARLTVTNHADVELHELVAFRLADSEDRPLTELLQLPQPELQTLLGSPTAVLVAEPGASMIATVGDGTLDEPGRYALVCFIPTGVEPSAYLAAAAQSPGGPPQIDGAGPPHLVHGMHAELTVG